MEFRYIIQAQGTAIRIECIIAANSPNPAAMAACSPADGRGWPGMEVDAGPAECPNFDVWALAFIGSVSYAREKGCQRS